MLRFSFRGRRLVALPAVALALVIGASPVLGLSFGSVQTIATAGWFSGPQSMVAVGDTVHMAYSENGLIRYRRSPDGGSSWQDARQLTYFRLNSNASTARVAASGQRVLVLWTRSKADGSRSLYIKRSNDGGDTWSSNVRLVKFQTGTLLTDGTVAITGLRAVVAWTDGATGGIDIRRSTDGGVTWTGPTTLGVTSHHVYAGGPFHSQVTAAAADGRIFVAFIPAENAAGHGVGIRMRRTTDGGETWGGAPYIDDFVLDSAYPMSLSASGPRLVIAYRYDDGRILVSSSADRARTWSQGYATSEATAGYFGAAIDGQHVRLVYSTTHDAGLLYRTSGDGGHSWRLPHQASTLTMDVAQVGVALGSGGTAFAWGEVQSQQAPSGILHTRYGE
jgi:hypothetical protein